MGRAKAPHIPGGGHRISGSLPGELLRQPQLEQVFLHNNELTGPIPTSLGANLSSLLLGNNKLSGPIPAAMGRLKKLTDLRLNRNQLSGPIPANLADAASLQVLRLDHNRLSGPIRPASPSARCCSMPPTMPTCRRCDSAGRKTPSLRQSYGAKTTSPKTAVGGNTLGDVCGAQLYRTVFEIRAGAAEAWSKRGFSKWPG